MIWTTQKRVGSNRQGVNMNPPITVPLRATVEAVRDGKIVSRDNYYMLTKFGKPFTQKSIPH